MSGGPAEAALNDARTLLAALLVAGGPKPGDRLVAALGWTPDRLAGALHDAELSADLTDPVALTRTAEGDCSAVDRADRLTAAQRAELSAGDDRRAVPAAQR